MKLSILAIALRFVYTFSTSFYVSEKRMYVRAAMGLAAGTRAVART